MFKVGDKVKCTAKWHQCENAGGVVTVAEVRPSGEFRVEEYATSAPGHLFMPGRYELVQPSGAQGCGQRNPHAVPPVGRKDDSGKLDMTLLDDMPRAIEAVVEVMQWAITKKQPVPYVRGSWLGVEPDRYRAAILRHMSAAAKQTSPAGDGTGNPPRLERDHETSLLHLAHVACSALFALESTLREIESTKA